jgi:hypothetical protein
MDGNTGRRAILDTDVIRVKAGLLAEAASVPSSNTLESPLDSSVHSMSNLLSEVSVQSDPDQAAIVGDEL